MAKGQPAEMRNLLMLQGRSREVRRSLIAMDSVEIISGLDASSPVKHADVKRC